MTRVTNSGKTMRSETSISSGLTTLFMSKQLQRHRYFGRFKAIVNLFSYEKVALFLREITHLTNPCKKSYFFLSIQFSLPSTTSVFVSL